MKKLASVTLGGLCLTAQAAIIDLNHTPQKGDFIYELNSSSGTGEYTVDAKSADNTAQVEKYDLRSLKTAHTLNYGVTQTTFVITKLEYDFYNKEKNTLLTVDGATQEKSKETNDNGLGDFSLGASHRLNSTDKVDFDISGLLSLSIGDAKKSWPYTDDNGTEKASEDGNIRSGGWAGLVQGKVTFKSTPLPLQFRLGYKYNSSRDITELNAKSAASGNPNREREYDSRFDYLLGGTAQFKFGEKSAFDLNADMTIVGKQDSNYKEDYDENGTDESWKGQTESYSIISLGGKFSYLFQENIVAHLSYTYTNNDDAKTTNSSTPVLSGTSPIVTNNKDYSVNTIALGLVVKF